VVLAALSVPAHAQVATPAENPCAPAIANGVFSALTNRAGLVDLRWYRAGGAPVAYFECVDGVAQPLGVRSHQVGDFTTFRAATTWRCDRLTRRFVAATLRPDGMLARGSSGVRTSSCARRFELDLPRRAAAGHVTKIRIVDRWGLGGIAVKLCVAPPRHLLECRDVRFAPAARAATRRLRPDANGRWRVELRVRSHRVRGAIAVGVDAIDGPVPPTVLATGDSTMQGVESFLAEELGDEATVVSDVRPGLAISKRNPLLPIALKQVARVKPHTTVVSIGAVEGFAMRGADGASHNCCDEAWVTEYARRVRESMLIYRQRERGRVFWLTIPGPSDPARVPIVAAVNSAIVRAAVDLKRVRVLRMDLIFTPQGYRDVMRYRGRDIRVREGDGIHLNVAGTAIAARAVAQALRALSGAGAP
jgi:hypothetical protein